MRPLRQQQRRLESKSCVDPWALFPRRIVCMLHRMQTVSLLWRLSSDTRRWECTVAHMAACDDPLAVWVGAIPSFGSSPCRTKSEQSQRFLHRKRLSVAPLLAMPALQGGETITGRLGLLGACDDTRQADREGRPTARRAFDANVSTHHPTKAAADGEPQPGAAVLAGRRCVSLNKVLEQPRYLLRCHADSSIGYTKHGPVSAVFRRATAGDPDRAVVSELGGIAGEIDERLTQPLRIGMSTAEIDGTVDLDAVAVLLSQRTDGGRDLLDERRGVDRFEMHFHLAGIDLRQVKNIVDQRQQMLRRAKNPFQRLDRIFALEVASVLEQHLANSDDRIQRSTQLVAHIGEKL